MEEKFELERKELGAKNKRVIEELSKLEKETLKLLVGEDMSVDLSQNVPQNSAQSFLSNLKEHLTESPRKQSKRETGQEDKGHDDKS